MSSEEIQRTFPENFPHCWNYMREETSSEVSIVRDNNGSEKNKSLTRH
jgi:hypothetical protein